MPTGTTPAGAFFALIIFLPAFAYAQAMPGQDHGGDATVQTLSQQIEALREQVSDLQTKISSQSVDTASMIRSGGEKRIQAMGATGGAGAPPAGSGAMPSSTSGSMPDMMAGMMSMMSSMMGGMGGMGGAAPMGQSAGMGSATLLSSLPGYPGASHLYHVGSTNFFLDHPEHITLSLEQQNQLGSLRTKSLLSRSEANRRIQEGEEQLWLLTASDQPNYSLIETKVREIEKLRSEIRLGFIKDVGEAAAVLTDEQRRAVLGQPGQSMPGGVQP